MRTVTALALLALSALCRPTAARAGAPAESAPPEAAAEAEAPLPRLRPLRYDLQADLPLTFGAAAVLLVGTLAREPLGPAACRACAPNAFDVTARDALLLGFPDLARTASGALSAGLALTAGAGALLVARADGDPRQGLVDLVVIGEAVVVALDAALVLQHATGRQRPFVRYGNYPDPARPPLTADNLSFPSGQATFAFSLVAATSSVAFLRGWRHAPWVLGVGLVLASAVGYLRVAGDVNYATDVLAGAALGGLIGGGLPWLLHRPEEAGAVRLRPAPGGLALVF